MGRIEIPGLIVAGPEDLKAAQPMEAPMDYRWIMRLNGRILGEIGKVVATRVDYVKFVPDLEQGVVYIVPAESDEYGAEKLHYEETENAATVSLFLALFRFRLPRQRGRVRIFKVEERSVGGMTLPAIVVRDSKLVPAKSRRGDGEAAGTGQATPGDD